MNFTWDAIRQARANFDTLQNTWRRLHEYTATETVVRDIDTVAIETAFVTALEDDINTPEALAVWLRLATESNRLMDNRTLGDAPAAVALFDTFAKLLGLTFEQAGSIPEHIRDLGRAREEARKQKEFTRADELRKKIETSGYLIEDTSTGTKIRRA